MPELVKRAMLAQSLKRKLGQVYRISVAPVSAIARNIIFGSESGTGLRVAGFLLCRKIEKADVPFSKRASSDVFSNVGTHGRPRCVVIDNLGHKGARMNLHDGFRAL
jgi:hypothetical protein